MSGARLVGGHCIESSELRWKCSEHWSRRACSRGASCVQALAARLSAAHLEDIARLSGAHLVVGHCMVASCGDTRCVLLPGRTCAHTFTIHTWLLTTTIGLWGKCSEHWSRRACSREVSGVQAWAARLSGAHFVRGHCKVEWGSPCRVTLYGVVVGRLTTTIGLWGKCSEH